MLGQPGEDRFYGNGGDDMIDARDGVRDFVDPVRPRRTAAADQRRRRKAVTEGTGEPAGRALTDSFDPAPSTAPS